MIDRREFCIALGATALLSCRRAPAQSEVFVPKVFQNARKQSIPYRLFTPASYDIQKSYPLVLWLCGSAGRGNDNLKQISIGNMLGTHVWTTTENQAKNPCFVVAPQCPENEEWTDEGKPTNNLQLALELIEDLASTLRIDRKRLYVAGQSMGGFGAWAAIATHPEMFAAAIPLCGGGDDAQAPKLIKQPIWAFHGDQDDSVPVERSRKMIAAIRQAGGNPKYTEYKGVGHVVWEKAFNEPELLPWVFAQKRSA